MKFSATAIFLPLALSPLIAATPIPGFSKWKLILTNTEGGTYNMEGRINSGCNNLDRIKSVYPMKQVEFKGNAWTDEFELYEDRDCKAPMTYSNKKGKFDLKPNRMIKSYKVY